MARAVSRVLLRPFVFAGDLLVTGIVVLLALPVWFLPRPQSIALARGYGYLAAACWPPGRRIAAINLARAYGRDLNRSEIRRLTFASFASIAQSIAEKMQTVRQHGATDPAPEDICEFEHQAALAKFREPGPRVFVQAHLGSWEVGGAVAMALVNHRGAAIIRDLDNVFLNRIVARLRFRHPSESFDKRGGARKALKRLRMGDSIGMVMDEDAGPRGLMTQFFGRPASTSLLAARLALLTGSPLFVAACLRRPGQKFLYRLELIEVPPVQSRAEAERLITQRIVSVLERWIRDNPEQWRWMHWRWKTRPDGGRETYGSADLRRARREADVTRASRREDALLIGCCRSRPLPADVERIQALAEGVNWTAVLRGADAHMVLPLVLANLARAHVEIPEAALEPWREVPPTVTRDNLALLSQLTRLTALLARHDIPAVTWKGPVFTSTAFGAFNARRSSDLDLLVPFDRMPEVQTLLTAEGYEFRPHVLQRLIPRVWNEFVFEPRDPREGPVEIHPSIALWCALAQPATEQLIARSVPVTVAGCTVRTLCNEDTLLAIVLHGAFHWWMGLRLVVDVDAAARASIDWDVLMKRSRQIGIRRLMRTALLTAHDLLDTPVPGPLVEDARRDRLAGWLAGRLAHSLSRPTEPPTYPGDVVALLAHDRITHRVRHTFRLFVWRDLLTRAERAAGARRAAP